MAIPETTVNGPLVLPDGTAPTRAVVRFELASWDKDSGEVILRGPRDFACDANGDFSASLWASTEGVQSMTYKVTASYYNRDTKGTITNVLGFIAVPTSGPVLLADLLVEEAVPVTTPEGLALMAAYLADAENAADVASAAAVNAALGTPYGFETVQAVIDDVVMSYTAGAGLEVVTAGQYILADEYRYQAAASGATDSDLQNSATIPVKMYATGNEIRPEQIAPNTTPLTTDMTSAVQKAMDRASVLSVPFKPAHFPALVSSQITMPTDLSFVGQGGSNYANFDRTKGAKIASSKVTAGAVLKLNGTKLVSQGGNSEKLWVTSTGVGATTDLTGVGLYGIEANNLFNYTFENLVVEHFNGAWAFWSSGQCNALVFERPRILIGGARVAGVSGAAYGGGLYLVAAPDSTVIDPYIESVDGNGIYLGGNSKVRGGFIDLCVRGVLCANGDNSSIEGASIKFHDKNCVYVFDSKSFTLRGVQAKSGNVAGAAYTSSDAPTVRFASGVENAKITECNFVHAQQWRGPNIPPVITLGDTTNTAHMADCTLGDVVNNGVHIYDAAGCWAAGNFEFYDNTLSLGSSRLGLDAPVAYTSGLTAPGGSYTVTYLGSTYVKKAGDGATVPYTTPSTFDPAEWVLLQERDKRGLVIPIDVTADIGTLRVSVQDGATDDWALTLGQRSNIEGTVKTVGVTKLMQAGGGSIGPSFICDARPATIATATSTNGAVSLRGLSWPVNVSHTGSGVNENFALADLPAAFSGKVTVTGRQTSSLHLSVTADVNWDGTTLTVTNLNSVDTGSAVGVPTFIASGGELMLRVSSATATNIECKFAFSDGMWTVE